MTKKLKQSWTYIKNMNLTYSRKIVLWGLLFFIVSLIPAVVDWNIYDSSANLPYVILIYTPIYLVIYFVAYLLEVRTTSNITIYQAITYLLFALVFSIITMAMYYISFAVAFGYDAVLPGWSAILIQIPIFMLVTILFFWTIQVVLLNTLFDKNSQRANETSIRLFFKTFFSRWTSLPYGDMTLVISRRSIYIIKMFYDKDNIKSITFAHEKEVQATNQPSPEPIKEEVKELTLGSAAPIVQAPLMNKIQVPDDYEVSNIKILAESLKEILEIDIRPIFIFDGDKPLIYHKPNDFILTTIADFKFAVKEYDKQSNLKITHHDRIINEIKK